MNTDLRGQLLALLQDRAVLHRDVVLSSGEKSTFYIDGKMVEVSPLGAFLIGEVLYESLDGEAFDAVGGLAVGAVPLVTSLAISCHHHHRKDVEGFWVREEAKAHGTQKLIEGNLPDNAKVVIVDDVVTSGKSVMKAIDAVEARGAKVIRILSIVDRDRGARELFTQRGYEYRSIFTKDELLANTQV
ncbi:MAG: orotate phosphoribosyltransferase [Pirellulales bacterium]